jgi:nitroreductase
METWHTIRARRNVRQYTDQPIARENLERILEAGRRAPSSGNWQPWNFVVVTDREQLVELAKVWQGARHIAQSAATIALVAQEPDDQRHRDWLMYAYPAALTATKDPERAGTTEGVGAIPGHLAPGMAPKAAHGVRTNPLSWSPVTESNRRPSPYHGDALPTELTGPVSLI